MVCRSLLICFVLLSVIFIKANTASSQMSDAKEDGPENRSPIAPTRSASNTKIITPILRDNNPYDPTTTRRRHTMAPNLQKLNPQSFTRSVTARNPMLKIQDPRPRPKNVKPFKETTTTEREFYKYNVTIEGFHFALTMVVLATQIEDQRVYVEHSLTSSYYYNKIYRVMLRYISSFREWLSGTGSYTDTHKLWRKKLHYVNEFVPTWLRSFIPWVPKSEWTKEEENYKKFHEEVEMKPIFIKNPYYHGKGTYWEES